MVNDDRRLFLTGQKDITKLLSEIELTERLDQAARELWVWKSLAAIGWLAFIGTLIAWGEGK